MEIIFATHNRHKFKEVEALIPSSIKLISLWDLGFNQEIPEEGETLEANALSKATTLYQKFNANVIADDTALEVDALNGAPGVMSARYAGPNCNSTDNMTKLLKELGDNKERSARFITVVALIYNGKEHLFRGVLEGEIITTPQGDNGFGYDPIFKPEGSTLTLAQIGDEEKNRISHRAKALEKLNHFLKTLFPDGS